MKKIIIVTLVLVMVFVNCGFTSPRAFDYSEVIEELESEGFTKRGDVWTLEDYHDDELVWAVAWFDVLDNYGVIAVYSRIDDSDYRATMKSSRYVVEWDYDESEFVIVEGEEYTK